MSKDTVNISKNTEDTTNNSKKIKVKLIRSYYGRKDDQIATIKALGLKRINDVREHDDNAVIRGMIFKVKHLVEIL